MTRWLDVLPLYAGVQIDLVRDAGDWSPRGARSRLAALPALCEGMLDDLGSGLGDEGDRLAEAMPRVGEMCDELAAYGIPETIEHDDLHDGQVYVSGGRYMFLDWGDACVSHPFFTMAVTLEGVIAWGSDDTQGSVDTTPFRDAYLRPFAPSGRDAGSRTPARSRRGSAGSAARSTRHLAGSKPAETRVRLRMFLDGHP